MAGLTAVLRKELKCFTGSDKSTFLIYAALSILWSFTLNSGGPFMLVFFSMVVVANLSNTVFISERVSGTLEVFITSGLSRDAILFGKMIFVIAVASAIGLVCVSFSAVWDAVLRAVLPDDSDTVVIFMRPFAFGFLDAAFYLASFFFYTAASAYLSVRMPNPRFLHFINLFMTLALVTAYETLRLEFLITTYSFYILVFLIAGVLFTLLARREFSGERITRPVVF